MGSEPMFRRKLGSELTENRENAKEIGNIMSIKRGLRFCRRKILTMLGPNPYDSALLEPSDHMSLRMELTLKQITDVLSTIIHDPELRNMTVFNNFLKPDPKASRKIV